jgi:integrase
MARGCIRQRGDSWQVLWREPGTGRQKSATFTNKRDAERKNNEIQRALDTGTYNSPTRKTVGEFLLTWLEGHSAVAPSSRHRYRIAIERHLIPELGAYRLSGLRPIDIQEAYSQWRAAGLSPRTIKLHHAILHRALGVALKLELIARNPADSVEAPPTPRGGKRVLTDDEISQLLAETKGSPHYIPVVLGVTAGLRLGEVCALAWDDVDLEGGQLTVNRTAAVVGKELVLREMPKTKHSRRTVSLPAVAVEALAAAPRTGRFVYGAKGDGPAHPDHLSKSVKALCSSLGKPVTMHGLRHTHASHLMRGNIHPKVVAARLGHSAISITLDTYSHLMPDQQRGAAEFVDAALTSDRRPCLEGRLARHGL